VSFSGLVRRARDASLPMNVRVAGLRGALRHYRPIGFEASFSFLASTAGNLRKDPEALGLAVDLLTTSHAAWQADLRAYGAFRRRAKELGHRVPHPSAPNPNRPSHWYGAPREAALHAVWFWYSKGASSDVDVHSLAAALVRRGRLTAVQRAMLFEVRDRLLERYAAVDGPRDLRMFSELRESLTVVRQMAVVVG